MSSINSNLFAVHEIRYSVNATKLRVIRKRLGAKQSAFARMCGWSRSYQAKLENNEVLTISEASADIISAVIVDLSG